MFGLLEIFLEVWKIKVGPIKYEMDEEEVKGIKKKVKSVFKTCKRISKEESLKAAMLEFPKKDLKNNPDLMFAQQPLFKAIEKSEMTNLSKALGAIYEFLTIMFTYFDLDFNLEPKRAILAEKTLKLNGILKELEELNAKYTELVNKVEELKENLKEKENFLNELEAKMALYKNRLKIATSLTKGLASEKKNWMDNSEK